LLALVVIAKAQTLTTVPVLFFSNAYIIHDGTNAVLIDSGINATHANLIVQALANIGGITLTGIFITHGHPDHYSGVAYLPAAFDVVPIYVGDAAIKRDLLENILANQATLPTAVLAFDYATRVQPLPTAGVLTGLVRNLSVITTYKGAETKVFGFVYDSVQKVLYTGDLLIIGQHGYFGPTTSVVRVRNWIGDIQSLQISFPDATALYPGHGTPIPSVSATAQFRFYLQRFLGLINACVPPASLKAQMIHLFPRFNATSAILDFILLNPNWATYQSVACDVTSTRTQTCALLDTADTCKAAKPYCLFRSGVCVASLVSPKVSVPFGRF